MTSWRTYANRTAEVTLLERLVAARASRPWAAWLSTHPVEGGEGALPGVKRGPAPPGTAGPSSAPIFGRRTIKEAMVAIEASIG